MFQPSEFERFITRIRTSLSSRERLSLSELLVIVREIVTSALCTADLLNRLNYDKPSCVKEEIDARNKEIAALRAEFYVLHDEDKKPEFSEKQKKFLVKFSTTMDKCMELATKALGTPQGGENAFSLGHRLSQLVSLCYLASDYIRPHGCSPTLR